MSNYFLIVSSAWRPFDPPAWPLVAGVVPSLLDGADNTLGHVEILRFEVTCNSAVGHLWRLKYKRARRASRASPPKMRLRNTKRGQCPDLDNGGIVHEARSDTDAVVSGTKRASLSIVLGGGRHGMAPTAYRFGRCWRSKLRTHARHPGALSRV